MQSEAMLRAEDDDTPTVPGGRRRLEPAGDALSGDGSKDPASMASAYRHRNRLNDNPENTAANVFRLIDQSTEFGGKMTSAQGLHRCWAYG